MKRNLDVQYLVDILPKEEHCAFCWLSVVNIYIARNVWYKRFVNTVKRVLFSTPARSADLPLYFCAKNELFYADENFLVESEKPGGYV